MPTGSIWIAAALAEQAAPLAGVRVTVLDETGVPVARLETGEDGTAVQDNLPAPDRSYSLEENNTTVRPYAVYDLVAEKDGSKGYGAYIGRTEYRNDETQLVVKDFKIRQSTGDSGQDAPVENLKHFGINNQQETVFDIVKCDGKEMILESDYARLELKKF